MREKSVPAKSRASVEALSLVQGSERRPFGQRVGTRGGGGQAGGSHMVLCSPVTLGFYSKLDANHCRIL